MRAKGLVLHLLVLGCAPGCYLLSSAEIKEVCEDLPGGCAGEVVATDDADGDGVTVADGDCDDAEPAVFPGADDSVGDGVDQNCDGADGVDADGDLFASVASGGEDCDDSSADVSPAAVERCEAGGVDEDCDGLVNDDDPGVQGGVTAYFDEDGDGYGGSGASAVYCAAPAGWVAELGDCDDARADVNPGEAELCGDGLDNDCDGVGGCRPIEGPTPIGGASGLLGTDLSDEGFAMAAWQGAAGGVLAIGGPSAEAYNGAIKVASFSAGAGGALIGEVEGTVLGVSGGNVGAGVLLAPVLRGGGLGLVSVGADGVLAVFDAGSLRGGAEQTVLDAVVVGEGFYPGSAYEGHKLAAADFTSDGVADLVVGAGGAWGTGYNGAVYIFRGGGSGSVTTGAGYAAVLGEDTGSYSFGYSVEAGDLDGDGLPELIAADPWAELPSDPVGGGVVAIFAGDGLRGVLRAADADATITSAVANEYGGWNLSIVDYDGDGRDDLLSAQVGAGACGVYASPTRGRLRTTDAIATFESGVPYGCLGMLPGDLDGDGALDVVFPSVIGLEPGDYGGSLWAAYGPLPLGVTSFDRLDGTVYGEVPGAIFSFSSAVADLDGDGGSDVAARGESGIYLFRGGGF